MVARYRSVAMKRDENSATAPFIAFRASSHSLNVASCAALKCKKDEKKRNNSHMDWICVRDAQVKINVSIAHRGQAGRQAA